jgi:hypothetical protein
VVSAAVKKRRTHLDTHGSLVENQLPYGQSNGAKHNTDESAFRKELGTDYNFQYWIFFLELN